jgi:phage gp46-like protein
MIALVYDNVLGEADAARAEDGGLGEGDELLTAILISLYTDRRVDASEAPPGGDRGGWWGDAFPDELGEEDPIGSRLWLLERGVTTPDAVIRARAYALEALAWMEADGIASAIEVVSMRNGRGRIDLAISLTPTEGARRTYLLEA